MSKPVPFRHAASRCPACRQILNATQDEQGRGPPKGGDLTICNHCGEILRFSPALFLTAVTPAEIERLPHATAKELLAAKDRFLKSHTRRLLRSVH